MLMPAWHSFNLILFWKTLNVATCSTKHWSFHPVSEFWSVQTRLLVCFFTRLTFFQVNRRLRIQWKFIELDDGNIFSLSTDSDQPKLEATWQKNGFFRCWNFDWRSHETIKSAVVQTNVLEGNFKLYKETAGTASLAFKCKLFFV